MALDRAETGDGAALPATQLAPILPPEHRRFPLLDPMRALAAIAVLAVHAALFAGSLGSDLYGPILAHLDIGVPFFFVLSAFLLYRPFLAARVFGHERSGFAGYGLRRFVRIMPAYWVALTIAAIIPGVAGAFSGNWWVYYGLLQNYPIYTADPGCVASPFNCGISVSWSLAIEVLFYALLPFYVLAMAALAARWRGRNWLVPEILAVGVLSAASFAIQANVPQSDLSTWLFFSPIGRGWWFGLGLGLAALSVWAQQRRADPAAIRWLRRRPLAPVAIALAIFLVSCYLILTPGPSLAFPVVPVGEYLYEYVAFGIVAVLVLAPAVFAADGRSIYVRALEHRAMAWLGLVSYGIFLWQLPVLLALNDIGFNDRFPRFQFPLTFAATLALTVVIAAISYYALERPLMRRVRRRLGSGSESVDQSGAHSTITAATPGDRSGTAGPS